MMKTVQLGSASQWLLVLSGVVVGFVAAQSGNTTQVAQAEVRETAPRAAFQAGSERSETVLQDIFKTLKTIDGRLERIEKIAAEKKLP